MTLTRPKQLNALNSEVLELLGAHLHQAGMDPSVGCIVIQGSGERAFCAGADLREIQGLDVVEAQRFIRQGHAVMNAVAGSQVPIIAAVDGFALGGGFELVLACHVVIASDRSSFGLPEARIGCIPGFGGTQRLTASVGKPIANLLLLSGERIDAGQAWQVGLLSREPLPADALDDETTRLAELIASGSRQGLANLLEVASRATQPRALAHEAALAALAIASPDGQEGINAFAERRPPQFHQET